MEQRQLGKTGLAVTPLGIGLAELGFQLDSSQAVEAGRVLNAALDAGITFLDTAGCYGNSEEFLGANVAQRRSEFVLSSKTGHMGGACAGDDPAGSWSYACVAASIDRSLRRLRTDHIDIMHLHSCGVDVLECGDAIRALEDARSAGKIAHVAYSGDNDAALWAARSGVFEVIQTSFNLVDQKARYELFDEVASRGLGLIAKRPIANAVWRTDADPDRLENGYSSGYFERQRTIREGHERFPGEPDDRILASLGYVLAHEAVDTAIIGSRDEGHVRANIRMMDELPVPPEFVAALQTRFDEVGREWPQLT